MPHLTTLPCSALLLAGLCLLAGPPSVQAADPPPIEDAEEQPELLARVTMDLVSGLETVDRHPRPLRRKLGMLAPDGLDVSALPEGTWLYGAVPLTKTNALSFAVSKDRRSLWFDGNGDSRLENSEAHSLAFRRGNVQWFRVKGPCVQEVDGKTHEELMPMAVGVTRAPGLASYSRLDAYRRGTLKLDGQELGLAIVDRTFRGWFSHLHRDQLLVDLNHDGIFDARADSNETYRLGSAFPFGERDLKVTAVGPLGTELQIVASEKPAKRLASLTMGSAAPDFTAESIEGNEVALNKLRGSWVLLDFWATWCGPCLREIPHLKAVRDTMPDLKIIGISADRSLPPLTSFVKRKDISWPQIYDKKRKVRSLFRVSSFPTTYLIAPDGTIAGKNLRGAKLKERIATTQKAWEERQTKTEEP